MQKDLATVGSYYIPQDTETDKTYVESLEEWKWVTSVGTQVTKEENLPQTWGQCREIMSNLILSTLNPFWGPAVRGNQQNPTSKGDLCDTFWKVKIPGPRTLRRT